MQDGVPAHGILFMQDGAPTHEILFMQDGAPAHEILFMQDGAPAHDMRFMQDGAPAHDMRFMQDGSPAHFPARCVITSKLHTQAGGLDAQDPLLGLHVSQISIRVTFSSGVTLNYSFMRRLWTHRRIL
ncbi:hypothetical protein AVEN_227032-1 [Araneus ventricosus]|uniref:Uncharacterized protein n=1 Tax=Araneus ventricosus TaxID=182803 RepID=A0A4Y2M8B8_ARAVE|nr:hypothetical protein AVEN_227032-1 [Araneus ventricosus]